MNKLMIGAAALLFTSNVIAEETVLTSDKQKLSYGIGLQIGQSLASQGVDPDPDALLLAIKDMLAGQPPRVSQEELQRLMVAEEQRIKSEQANIAEKNLVTGQAFLADNKKREGIKETASGLQYRIIEAGTGSNPTLEDTVTVHYKGTLINGTEFDSSYARGEPATFPVNGVVKGWQEALPMIKEGGKWEIFVPSQLAYGERGAGGSIGPNETLIFQIELISIKK